LKQLFLTNSLQKRKRKWQLKREIQGISALDLVKSLAVLDFASYTRESKGICSGRDIEMPCNVLGSAGINGK
jgi:hypothetical protein